MGAVPGSRLLRGTGARPAEDAFDVEPFRTSGRRVVLREVDRPLLVLGSTQPLSVVDADRARRRGVGVARRRSGGGAVLLVPGAQVWADLWVPRDDPLWSAEPRGSAVFVGEWWARALAPVGPVAPVGLDEPEGLTVHAGASVPAAPGSEMICFAGLGPGEVRCAAGKIVGLAQWRSREGALVHGCAYRHWEPGPLVDLLDLAGPTRRELHDALRDVAVGVEDLGAVGWGHDALLAALPDPESWDVARA